MNIANQLLVFIIPCHSVFSCCCSVRLTMFFFSGFSRVLDCDLVCLLCCLILWFMDSVCFSHSDFCIVYGDILFSINSTYASYISCPGYTSQNTLPTMDPARISQLHDIITHQGELLVAYQEQLVVLHATIIFQSLQGLPTHRPDSTQIAVPEKFDGTDCGTLQTIPLTSNPGPIYKMCFHIVTT